MVSGLRCGLTVNYKDLKGELAKHDIRQVDFILCLNDTDGHWEAISKSDRTDGPHLYHR